MASKGKNASENIGEQNQQNQQQQQQQPLSIAERDKVKQEREARRKAKVASKQKLQDKSRGLPDVIDDNDKKKSEQNSGAGSSKVGKTMEVATTKATSPEVTSAAAVPTTSSKPETKDSDKRSNRKGKTHGKNKSERPKDSPDTDKVANELVKMKINEESKSPVTPQNVVNFEKPEKKPTTKAERRAKQAAEREAKAAKLSENKATSTTSSVKKSTNESKTSTGEKSRLRPKENTPPKMNDSSISKSVAPKKSHQHRVKLFNHLYLDSAPNTLLNSNVVHPAIVRLGEQYSGGIVKGCNARGLAFMSAIKIVISDYKTPSQKEFGRSLEDVIKKCGNFLHQCRPLAVSVTNAMKFILFQLRQLPKTEVDAKVMHIVKYNNLFDQTGLLILLFHFQISKNCWNQSVPMYEIKLIRQLKRLV